MSWRRTLAAILALAGIAAAALAARQFVSASADAGTSAGAVPTTRVTRGSLPLVVYMTGDLRAARQMSLTAPAVGGALRILTLLETGTIVKKDDTIMTFDPADQQYALEQAESELLEAEQELIKRRAEIKAQEAQDQVGLLTARFDVRRAELDAALDADLIAANDYKIRQAELREARRNLARLEQDVTERAITSKASLAVLEERRTRARLSADRARQNMDNLVLVAPMDGVVALRENPDASGGVFFSGMSLPTFRAGDTVSSGRPVVDVYDVSSMEIRAQVNEQERANVSVGQSARVISDAVSGLTFNARVSAIAGLGRIDNTRGGPLRLFDVTLDLRDPDPRLVPGTSVRVETQGAVVENVRLLPRQALFELDGKPAVFARSDDGAGFTARPVKVTHRTESRVAVDGLDEGVEVALVDPVAALKAPAEGAKK